MARLCARTALPGVQVQRILRKRRPWPVPRLAHAWWKAPDFTLLDRAEKKVRPSSFKIRKMSICFYPETTRS